MEFNPMVGAIPKADGTVVRVWAPNADTMRVVTNETETPMTPDASSPVEGLWTAHVDAPAGTTYWIEKDGEQLPDPASRFQPEGIHGPSEIVDPSAFAWSDDDWDGIAMDELVPYELHVGTFTPEGTFDAVRERLGYLRDLGVTAIELMPVHDFPGARNWGYDPAALFAPSRAYGRPEDLRRLVDAAHRHGLAVILDVIYNHFGPDGAYANAFAPFLTDAHETPWGPSMNLDGEGSEGVRRFFVDNALHWLRDYHVDGLRLDATHALHDTSETHFLTELSEAVDAHAGGWPRLLIAEDHRNLSRLVEPRDAGGHGLDGVWSDDLHHQLRHLTAGDDESYYQDYVGTTTRDVATTLRDGWYFRGQPSDFWGEPRGTDPDPVDRTQCVVFIQNHDQVGNRPTGDRLTESVSMPVYRALSALICFVEEAPLIFMGQEWAASTPFQFFTDHNDEIGPQVTEGRREEFSGFAGFNGDVPDPQDPETFERSILDWSEATSGPHGGVMRLYRDVLNLRGALGPADEVTAPTDTTLVIPRRPYTLLVNVEGEATFDVAENEAIVLHTEERSYTFDTHAPTRTGKRLHAPRPMAVLLRNRDLKRKKLG